MSNENLLTNPSPDLLKRVEEILKTPRLHSSVITIHRKLAEVWGTMVSELNKLRLIRDTAQLEYINGCQTCHDAFSILCTKGYMHLYGATFMANENVPFEVQLEIESLYEWRKCLSYALYEARDNYEAAYLQFNEFTDLCVKFQGYVFNLATIRSVEHFIDVTQRPYFILGLCLHRGGNFEQDPLYHLVEELDSFIDQEHDGEYTYTYTYNYTSPEDSSDEEAIVNTESTIVKFMRDKNAKIEFLKQLKEVADSTMISNNMISNNTISNNTISNNTISNNSSPVRVFVARTIKDIMYFLQLLILKLLPKQSTR
jgi:hypothetical protein